MPKERMEGRRLPDPNVVFPNGYRPPCFLPDGIAASNIMARKAPTGSAASGDRANGVTLPVTPFFRFPGRCPAVDRSHSTDG